MHIRLGFKLVTAMQAFSAWLALKAASLHTRLSIKKSIREHGVY
ncbi:hypothetical protein [Thiothrix winogradskyi]|nr:hypothetical protein [Thiothrix winogradskyi]